MVIPLRKIASSTTNNLASSLAARALRILGETVPAKLTRDVSKWEAEDVEEWLDIVGKSLYGHLCVKYCLDL